MRNLCIAVAGAVVAVAAWLTPTAVVATGAYALLASPGCAATATPRERYARAQDGYIAAVSTLLRARETGAISEETWQADILPLINIGNEALNAYDAATEAGISAEGPLETIRAVLEALAPFLEGR